MTTVSLFSRRMLLCGLGIVMIGSRACAREGPTIGLFRDADSVQIPAGQDMVATSGCLRAGQGAATYHYYAGVAKLVPGSFFTARDGRVFRLQSDWVTPAMLGASGDGRRDDHAALSAALRHLSQSGGGTLRLEQATYLCLAPLDVPPNVSIAGSGDASVFLIERSNLMNLHSEVLDGIRIADFQVRSRARRHGAEATTIGVINRDVAGVVRDLTIENVTFDTAGYAGNNMFFKFGPASRCEKLLIARCRFVSTGRMGLEIIQHDAADPNLVRGLAIADNLFDATGPIPGLAVQCSLSGEMTAPSIEGNRFVGRGTYLGLEMVGGQLRPRVVRNTWQGEFTNCFQNTTNSRAGVLEKLEFSQNRTTPGTVGTFKLAATRNARITHNTLGIARYAVLHFQGLSRDNVVSDCELSTDHTEAIFFDNSGPNAVKNNLITLRGSVPSTPALAIGRAAIGNQLEANRIAARSLGTMFRADQGAIGSTSSDNRRVAFP